MDLYKIIEDLHRERQKLDHAIRFLEELKLREEEEQLRRPRGRGRMTAEERQAASERMKKYWDERKARRHAADSATG